MRLPPLGLLVLAFAIAGCTGSSDGDEGQDMDEGPGSSMTGSMTGMPAASPRTHEVVMRNNLFVPADLAVRVGDTVHWTTEDPQAHNVVSTSEAASFRSADVSSVAVPGVYEDDFSYTFGTAGTVDYLCEYHGGMVGTIVVES